MQQLELAGRDYNRSEDVIKLLQSTQQSTPYQYAVLHCTGFIRFGCVGVWCLLCCVSAVWMCVCVVWVCCVDVCLCCVGGVCGSVYTLYVYVCIGTWITCACTLL